ncbi:MAG TPA: hypothetical protein PKV44_06670, partial [Bacillota bacterium]|nr:hypothetical protein [Bacillota bacterium]
LHELGHDRHFILFLLHFGIKCCSVAECLPDKLTVSKHCGAISHQVIVSDEEAALDFLLGQRWSLAFLLIFELAIALEDDGFVFVRGVPDLATVKTAAVSADDFAVKGLVTISPAQIFAPRHFFLYRLKFLWGNNGFMGAFNVVLGHFTIVDA